MKIFGTQQTNIFHGFMCLWNNLKLNKAAGSDNIPSELLKHGGRTLKQQLHKLIPMIWNNEQLPQWNEGIICQVYKKGDRLNYRLITLLNVAYKIFYILLNKRLIENKLEDNQMGVCPNRSIIDNIFIVRQSFEKSHEHNIDLYNIFVDCTHAFDSVHRNKIIEYLKKFDVPDKLTRLIALTLVQTRAV